MNKTETLIRAILGITHEDIRPLVFTIDEVAEQMLYVPLDSIRITKDIYPIVANRLGKTVGAVSRATERLCTRLWMNGDKELLRRVTGVDSSIPRTPRETVFYLAFYITNGSSMREALLAALSL